MDNTSSRQSLDNRPINPGVSDTVDGDAVDRTREDQRSVASDVENITESVDEQQTVVHDNVVDHENETVDEQERNVYGTNTITTDDYGYIKDENGQKIGVTKYTLLNEQKSFVEIIDYGATVVSCWVPNAFGELEDVLLGFDSIEDYRSRNTYTMGGTLGRVTDYISGGRIEYEDGGGGNETIQLSKNRGDHHFNGGDTRAFDKVVWDGFIDGTKLVLTYSSKDGEEGYPGTLQMRVTFWLTCKNELVVDYVGMASKPTPVNVSSNLFFNLAGHNAGESGIADHTIMVNADEYVAVRIPERRPIGLLKNVYHTCLDLRVPRLLKKAFPLVPGFGYHHTFKLYMGAERKAFNLAVSLSHKPSGRILDVYTDMPCVFVNTAQELPNYGHTLRKEEILNVIDITTPSAKFGASGPDDHWSEDENELASKSELKLLLLDNENGDREGGKYVDTRASSVYTVGNHSVPIIGKSNTVYGRHSGICVRPQLFPDAVTHKNFNSVILKPSNIYSQQTVYKFGIVITK